MDPYLAVIIIFGGNYAITGFQMCNGQTLSISQNTALFSLIGTYYGGNGTSTFQLPDLRGRTAIQQGIGPGLSAYDIGEQVGSSTATLIYNNIPLHNHQVNAYAAEGNPSSPANCVVAEGPKSGGIGSKAPEYYISATTPNTTLNAQAVGPNVNGGSNPFAIMQPYLAITHLISMRGQFPARN
jgi:microcystin-dependent protein